MNVESNEEYLRKQVRLLEAVAAHVTHLREKVVMMEDTARATGTAYAAMRAELSWVMEERDSCWRLLKKIHGNLQKQSSLSLSELADEIENTIDLMDPRCDD
jgi:hypothetical protein